MEKQPDRRKSHRRAQDQQFEEVHSEWTTQRLKQHLEELKQQEAALHLEYSRAYLAWREIAHKRQQLDYALAERRRQLCKPAGEPRKSATVSATCKKEKNQLREAAKLIKGLTPEQIERMLDGLK